MGNDLTFRPEELYCMSENYEYHGIFLEKLMQMGNGDLPDFDQFLPLWINFLGEKDDYAAKRLLEEAHSMVGDDEQALRLARKFHANHPELYLKIVQEGFKKNDDEKMLRIGLEALEKILDAGKIRNEIALLTSEYAGRLNERSIEESCWIEAFRSEPSAMNYLRIRFLTEEWGDWDRHKEQVRQIYESAYSLKSTGSDISYDYISVLQSLNGRNMNDYCVILFFEGKFKQVFQTGMDTKKALGWSYTFMKQGLALLLLLLYEGKEKYLPAGLKAMLSVAVSCCAFNADTLLRGTGRTEDIDDRQLFWDYFCRWKSDIVITEGERRDWMTFMEQQLVKRTDGIMEANRRNYYWECASYIAAFGEVQESQGIVSAKNRILSEYKGRYQRRRNFIKDLRSFGLKD